MAQHKLFVYPSADIRRNLESWAPVDTLTFQDLDAAIDEANAILDATQDPFLVDVLADPDQSSIEDYLRARNAVASWVENHPQSGALFSTLAGADHFRDAYGIETARELHDYLVGEAEHEIAKAGW